MILFSMWLQPGLWQDWVSGLPHHVEAGLQPRHIGVVCCQAQTKDGQYISSSYPQPLPDLLLVQRPISCPMCVPCSRPGPFYEWVNPHLWLRGSFCLCRLDWLLCFLAFLGFACAYKHIKKFFLYVLREREVLACTLSNIWILLTIESYEFLRRGLNTWGSVKTDSPPPLFKFSGR